MGAGAGKLGMLIESGLAMNLVTNLAAPPDQKSAKRSRTKRAISRGASQVDNRSHSSGGTPSKYSGYSAIDEPLLLHEKLQKYIKRIVGTAMPTVYAHKYLREQAKKAIRAAQEAANAAEDEALGEVTAATGFKSTLEKICYGPKPPNRTPPPGRPSPKKR